MARDSVLVWTPAKVNLFLEVKARRDDGYHEIETLMIAVNWYDTLEMRSDLSGELSLTCNRSDLSVGKDNLVLRAAELLRSHTGYPGGARIQLTKRIPMAAGLAGGSSDAAATLMGLNRLWELGLSRQELIELSSRIGSDIAFFFATPAAWATGRGEIVTPIPVTRMYDLVLICPSSGLSTASVYGQVRVPVTPNSGDAVKTALANGNIEELGQALFNRLQEPAMEINAFVRTVYERLGSMGVVGRLMSGSGSALLVLCRDAAEAKRVQIALRDVLGPLDPGVSVVHTRTHV